MVMKNHNATGPLIWLLRCYMRSPKMVNFGYSFVVRNLKATQTCISKALTLHRLEVDIALITGESQLYARCSSKDMMPALQVIYMSMVTNRTTGLL